MYTLKLNLREGWLCQIGWIFGKVPFSIQKFMLQTLGTLNRAFGAWNFILSGHHTSSHTCNHIHYKRLQYNFLKMRGWSKAVWNFSNNSSDLVQPPFPIQRDAKSQNPDWEHWIICLQSTGILMEPHFMLCQVLPDYFGRPTALRCLPSLIHAYLASLWLLVLCWRGPRLAYCIKTNVVVTY